MEQEGWRTPDHSWFEMEAADDGEIFFVNPILGFYEVECDEEEDDESWIDRPWPETGEPEWCGRSCCQEISMAAQEVVRLPQEEQPELKFPQEGQPMMELPQEE